jgi:hypothetical protein
MLSYQSQEESMPLTLNVGLSKKIGLPDYGSLGVSCNVQVELDSMLLQSDLDGFHEKVKRAYIACHQAVSDELHRQQPVATAGGQYGNGRQPPGNGTSQHGNAERRSARQATVSQVRAIHAIAGRLNLDLVRWLHEKFGPRAAAELSISEASAAIDELKTLPASSNGAPR